MRAAFVRAAVVALALTVAACDSGGTSEPPAGTSGFRFTPVAGTYTGTFTTATTVDGETDTVTRPLTITVSATGTPTVTLDPGAAAGESDPPPLTLTGAYSASGTTLRFPGDPPLVLSISEAGALSGGGDAVVFGGNLRVSSAGSFSPSRLEIVLTATVLQALPTAPAGSTQVLTLTATR